MDASKGKGDQGMQNPGGQMDRPVSFHFLESMLPKAVKRRVHALKRLQVQCANIEAKFYEEVHELERKYAALYQPLFDKRREIVTGTVEPTDEECEWQSDKEEEEELAAEVKEKAAIEDAKKEEATPEEDPKGIPEFWLTIFKSVDMLSDMLQEHDEPILKHLKDIQVKFSEPGQPMSFTLEFHFEPNGYFNNAVLTKVYKMKSEPDASDPFSFEGPEIIDCEGCQIDWHKGKDVTVKTIKKKQKHKGRGTVRTVTKQVPNDSFFNFFNPVKASPDGEMDEDSEFTLATDFEIGHFFRERIVPRAVLYFTGEALEDDESFEEEELEEGDEEEQDEEGDEDDDEGDFDPKDKDSKRIRATASKIGRFVHKKVVPKAAEYLKKALEDDENEQDEECDEDDDEGDFDPKDKDSKRTRATASKIGHFICKKVVPKAAQYFRKVLEDEESFEEEELEEGDEECPAFESQEQDEEGNFDPKKEQPQPAECKQQ